MPLDSKQRRTLAARGNRLTARLAIGGEEPTPAAVEHVRRAFGRDDLMKVRINTDDRDAFGLVVEWLAERVPCEVVQRVGRVALLFSPRPVEPEVEAPVERSKAETAVRKRSVPKRPGAS